MMPRHLFNKFTAIHQGMMHSMLRFKTSMFSTPNPGLLMS